MTSAALARAAVALGGGDRRLLLRRRGGRGEPHAQGPNPGPHAATGIPALVRRRPRCPARLGRYRSGGRRSRGRQVHGHRLRPGRRVAAAGRGRRQRVRLAATGSVCRRPAGGRRAAEFRVRADRRARVRRHGRGARAQHVRPVRAGGRLGRPDRDVRPGRLLSQTTINGSGQPRPPRSLPRRAGVSRRRRDVRSPFWPLTISIATRPLSTAATHPAPLIPSR